jgi:hypothetical protein
LQTQSDLRQQNISRKLENQRSKQASQASSTMDVPPLTQMDFGVTHCPRN